MKIPSKQRNAERSRQAIVQAAEELFAARGTRQVSLAEIAERAGVSRGLPSYFFGDKQKLSQTVMERAAENLRAAVFDPIRASHQMNPAEILSDLIDRYVDYLAANPHVVKLLQWYLLERDADSETHGPDIPANVLSEGVDLLADRVGSKVISGIEVIDLLRSIVAMCLFPLRHVPLKKSEQAASFRRHKGHIKEMAMRAIRERK